MGSHAVKFGGEVRHIRDDSDFAVRRPAVQFYSIHDFAQDEPRAITNIGINPSTGLIESNVRNFRFWEFGGYLQDDWKIASNLTLNLGIRYEWFGRPTEANDLLTNIILGQGSDIFEQVRTATVGAGRSGGAGRLQQLRAAARLLVGSDEATASSPCAAATASPTSGCSTTRSRTSASTRRTTRSRSRTRWRWRSQAGIPIAYGPINPDGTRRNEAITITGPNRNIGVQDGLGIDGNIIGWNPRVRHVAAVAARARSEHQGRLHAQLVRRRADRSCRGTSSSKRTTSATSAATSAGWSTTTRCAATCSTAGWIV